MIYLERKTFLVQQIQMQQNQEEVINTIMEITKDIQIVSFSSTSFEYLGYGEDLLLYSSLPVVKFSPDSSPGFLYLFDGPGYNPNTV